MAARTCPRCDEESVIPIVYGLPGDALARAFEQEEVVIGGCEIGWGDPQRYCRACHVSLFDDGTFLTARGEGVADSVAAVVDEDEDGTLVAEIGDDRHLMIRRGRVARRRGMGPDPVVVECTGADAFTVFLLILGRQFETGFDAAAWLGRHGIDFIGEGGGGVEKVGLVDGVGVVFLSSSDGIIIPSGSGERRVLLNALKAVLADGDLGGLDGFTAWLTEHGVDWRPVATTGRPPAD